MYGRVQEPYMLYSVFFSAIAVLYPFIISIVCGMSASIEEQAGHFQMMLAVPHSKIISFAGKSLLVASIECVIGRSRRLSLFGGDEICSSHQ